MKFVSQPVEFCAFLGDPNEPDRAPAQHVTIATYLDAEDGSRMTEMEAKRRTVSIEQATREGFDVSAIVKHFDTINARALVAAQQDTAEQTKRAETAEAFAKEVEDAARAVLAQNAELLKRAEAAETALASVFGTALPG